MEFPKYKILETELGPMISHSRSSVYDVMIYHDRGENVPAICTICNLTPMQVWLAIDYIEAHRAVLEPELAQILQEKAELERHYRAVAAEVQQKIDQLPMTPRRAKFYALLAESRKKREANEKARRCSNK